MDKKRVTRKTPSSYKIPFKSKISAQGDDSKLMIEQKKPSNDITNNGEKTVTIRNVKANKRQNQFKKLKCQKMKEHDERDFKYEDVNINSSNSCNFSEIKMNIVCEEGNKINTSFKNDENKVDNSLKSNDSSSVINSNERISDDYDKIIVDANLVMNEIINNVCEKELKLTTFKQLQFETDIHNQINEDWSTIQDVKSENRGMKDLLHNSSNKRKDNEKDLKNANYNKNSGDFKCQTESTGFRIEDKDDFKRKNEHVQDEVNDSVLKNTKHKKQKMDSKGFHAESKYANGNNDNFPKENKNFDSFYTNRNENASSSEFKTDNLYVSENSTLKENQTIDKTSSNDKNNKSINLKSPQKVENISLQVLINQTEQFEENFTDLTSDFKTKPGACNSQTSYKKTLTIPCMSALDYFNASKLTEIEGSTETDENSTLPSSSKELNHSKTVSLGTENIPGTQKESNETEFVNRDNNTKHTNENQTKDSTSHKALSCYKDKYKNKDTNSSTSLPPAKTETNNNLDKIQPHNLYTSDTMNIVSSISNFKTENNKDIGSSIFSEEEFIAEKIIFREKEESDDNDVIPTGVFKYLKEIFEYNTETTSIDLKCATPTKSNGFISEEYVTDMRKCNSSNEEMKIGVAMLLNNTKDSTVSINSILLKQDDLKFRKTTDEVNLDKNEGNIDKNINLSNSTNTVHANNNNVKLHNNEENIKPSERNEELTIEVEIKDRVNATESITNKDRKFYEEPCFTQRKTNEEKYFSDFDNCMEMDDDFDLTASQLSMLDANEKLESDSTNKINAEQQTDISGSTYSNNAPLMMEIISELHSLRESIECLQEKLDELSSRETKP
ncbi:hypothetical protein AVEN_41759-1 [Araneus ventricosus]|uniref:Uncharacterized protein n=1 Tax=Araneus ventricosus TaxID=182803 RepID=A0A4Y2AC01_ARAVE|nr:hypothetical protein AVEN_41759-1 [Araneus ventricosus]